eukprot:6411300-Amphidinium_carterae.1
MHPLFLEPKDSEHSAVIDWLCTLVYIWSCKLPSGAECFNTPLCGMRHKRAAFTISKLALQPQNAIGCAANKRSRIFSVLCALPSYLAVAHLAVAQR